MRVLFVDPTDFSRPAYGDGMAAVAASAVRVLGHRLALVGATSEPGTIGRWGELAAGSTRVPFLPVVDVRDFEQRRPGGANLQFAAALHRHRAALRAAGTDAVLTRVYTALWWLVFRRKPWDVCFYYPGLGNPMLIGRRPRLGSRLARLYEAMQARAIERTTIAFAAASQEAIDGYNRGLRRRGLTKRVQALPTAVDVDRFRPQPRLPARLSLGVPAASLVFAFVGRLAAVKGIPLLIEATRQIAAEREDVLLLLAGRGEEEPRLRELVAALGLERQVRFLGRLPPDAVARVMAAADACVVGSYVEGFSNAMIEAVACGCALVSTEVSGARDLIREGRNGFVVSGRSPGAFARAMLAAARLPDPERVSREIAIRHHSERALWATIAWSWAPLRDAFETTCVSPTGPAAPREAIA